MAGFNPLATQGNLNRVITHVVVADFPELTANAGYMSKGQAVVTFDGPFTEQIPTATGIVNSPLPFVMGQIVLNLLRSQILANNWIAQAQVATFLGDITVFSDSTVFDPVTLTNTSIIDFDPGAFDGVDPTVKVTLKGTYYVNSGLWASLTGADGNLPVTP